MITPAFNLTATERVLPRLALDFTTGVLDGRVTVTRALNTATRVNSSGFIEGVNADLPRFDYDPVSIGVCKGLLIEETRTNLYTYTEDFMDPAIWFDNAGTVTRTGNATIAPNGLQEGDVLGFGGNASLGLYRSFSVTSGVEYTVSFWAKSISGVTSGYRVTASTRLGGGNITFTPTTSWQRFTFTRTAASSGATSPVFGVTDTATKELSIWGVQAEAGAFATSYIPSVGATSLTRNADVVVMTGTNFSSWYTSSSAALAAVVIPITATGTRPIWQLDDTTANEIIALRGNVANPELYIVDGGVPQAQLDAGTITANTQYGLCAAFAANSCAVSQNGAAPVTTATATIPTVTQARIGSDGSNFLNGAVRTLRYWPQRVLNAETQAFSK
jgi:hypothetical protein